MIGFDLTFSCLLSCPKESRTTRQKRKGLQETPPINHRSTAGNREFRRSESYFSFSWLVTLFDIQFNPDLLKNPSPAILNRLKDTSRGYLDSYKSNAESAPHSLTSSSSRLTPKPLDFLHNGSQRTGSSMALHRLRDPHHAHASHSRSDM